MMGFLSLLLFVLMIAILASAGIRFLDQRRELRGSGAPPGQLERLESALSSLEARVSDLQDQQRFLERLLAERPEPPRLGGGEEGGKQAGKQGGKQGGGTAPGASGPPQGASGSGDGGTGSSGSILLDREDADEEEH